MNSGSVLISNLASLAGLLAATAERREGPIAPPEESSSSDGGPSGSAAVGSDSGSEGDSDSEGSSEGEPSALAALPALSDLSRALVLSDDPSDAVAVNDAHRRPDVADGPGSDLWSADQLYAAMPRQYKYAVPTVAPRHWPAPVPLTQEEYAVRFAAEFPEVASLGPTENVVVCGGAAAWPFGEPSVRVGDVDLFIYGIDPGDEGALWARAGSVVRRLTKAFLEGVGGAPPRAAVVTQALSPGLITLTATTVGTARWCRRSVGSEVKVQVILRAYPSVSAILHAFDIPAACVAYDWRRAYTTTLGAFALAFRVNVVVPAYRSTTYEARLIKYFGRGFALALPALRPGLLRKGETLALPHLTVAVAAARGRFATGTLALPAGAAAPASDYEPRDQVAIGAVPSAAWHAPLYVNLRQVASGEGRFVMMRAFERYPALHRGARPQRAIPFARYAREGAPTFADLCPRAAFCALADKVAGGSVDKNGRVNATALRRVFCLSEAQIAKLVAAVSDALAANPGAHLDLAAALAPWRAALLEKYDATPLAIGWWITTDPGRQYTASLNPRMEDAAAWYGDAYAAAADPPTADDFIEALLATLEARQAGPGDSAPVFDGVCPLCHDPLVRGAANSVVLPCGHIFHWTEAGGGCSGLRAWATEHSDCPTCRRQFGGEEPPADRGRVVVAVAW